MIERIIAELLFANHCVIVPKLGAFIANYKCANVQNNQTRIFPPSYQVVFNGQLKHNDGALLNAISSHYQISYAEAEKKLNDFAEEIKLSLKNNKSHIIEQLGRLYNDANGNILFESFQNNFSTQYYGLPLLSIQPISRLKDIVPSIIESKSTSQNSYKKRKSYAIFFMLIFILAGFGLAVQQTIKHNYTIKASILNLFKSCSSKKSSNQFDKQQVEKNENEITLIEQHTTNNEQQIKVVQPLVKEEISTENIEQQTQNIPQKSVPEETISMEPRANAYICVGAFQNRKNAQLIIKDVEFYGMKATVVKPNGSSLYRVLVLSHTSHIAEDMDKIRGNINAGAWLYCHHCSY